MADSDGDWGHLAEHDSEAAQAWDSFDLLPDSGENPVLDAFCERKRISIPALLRLGARLADGEVLAFSYDKGIKFRNMLDGRMAKMLIEIS